MKKVVFGILGTAIALAVGTTSAFAAGPGARHNFVDADNDDICDNARESICSYVDTDEDGICDNRGARHGNCLTESSKNFADADGDGICDNFTSGQNKGNGHRNGAKGECGKNFVDEDSDGICDNFTSREGRGNGHGFRHKQMQ